MTETKITYHVELNRQTGNGWERLSSWGKKSGAVKQFTKDKQHGEGLNKTGYWHYIYRITRTIITTEVIDE